jgi:hypothetical protein
MRERQRGIHLSGNTAGAILHFRVGGAFVPFCALWFMSAVLTVSALRSQTLQATTNRMTQVTLFSSGLYDNPIKDVSIDCILTGPAGMTLHVAGFWDGDSTFRVRFALPASGEWSYTITCSDTSNRRLHGIRGLVDVRRDVGASPLFAKGSPRVSANGRFLTFGDGDPFFYLGDTAWEIVWKSRREEVISYLANRKKRGFNAIHIVGMSHQLFYDWGIINRDGERYFIDSNYSRLNPRYFDYLDWLVSTANDSGFVVGLVPLWATMMAYHADPKERHQLSAEQALQVARYYGARYAGAHVVWIVGGDCQYTTTQQKEFWSSFAATLKAASGGNHLMSIHPKGWTASYDYFGNQTEWLDFQMFQSSHLAGADYTWKAGLPAWPMSPPKPLLNAEPCFEDIPTQFWNEADTAAATQSRITATDVRRAEYESILSGSLMGITYGANGVWQWNVAGLPVSSFPRDTVDQSCEYPGAMQMHYLRNLMIRRQWYTLHPSPDIVEQQTYDRNFLPVASNAETIIAYLPQRTASISFRRPALAYMTQYQWINPRTGDSLNSRPIAALQSFSPPDTNDWVLVLEKEPEPATPAPVPATFALEQNFPNPFNPNTIIRYRVPNDGRIVLKVYNTLGAEVATLVDADLGTGLYSVEFDGSSLPSGVYFYRMKYSTFTETKKCLLVK